MMEMKRLAFVLLLAALAAGCSSNPSREAVPESQAGITDSAVEQTGESFVSLPEEVSEEAEAAGEAAGGPGEEAVAESETAHTATLAGDQVSARQKYQALTALPEAESRALQFYLGSQTYNYVEDGEIVATGPIASGKASSPTPTGSFRVLMKDKNKESSRYDNEIGTPAWMPYSMQFYGNYFLHEGYLPGEPASHGCIRLGHYDARLLFDRMKVGDPVAVSK